MDAALGLSAVSAQMQHGLMGVKMASQQEQVMANVVEAAVQAAQPVSAAPAAPVDGKGSLIDILA